MPKLRPTSANGSSEDALQHSSGDREPAAGETLQMTLAILKMIPKVGKVSTSQIKQRLDAMGIERTTRTIQRTMDMLSREFPVEQDNTSRPYGYRWRPGSQGISVPELTLHESLALTMAEKFMKNLLPPAVTGAMATVFEQARHNLHADNDRLERRWLRKVRQVSTTQPLLPPKIVDGVFEEVTHALYHEHLLDVTYTNSAGVRKDKRVAPLGLAQQGHRMFLIARFEGYDNERALALNRIHKAVRTGLPMPKSVNFDFDAYEAEGRFGFGHGESVTLKFVLKGQTGQFLTESRLEPKQIHRPVDDGIEFTATVVKSAQLVWWLRGFGKQLLSLSPASLKREVMEG